MTLVEFEVGMIPYSYNMVDMGGIDLAEANGTVVPGVYEKITEAVNLCGDLILYNWKFADINIAPSACTVLQQAHSILINGLIQVTELDQITVIGLPPPIVPVSPLNATENGTYEATPPASGFNPVTVDVHEPPPVIQPLVVSQNGVYEVESPVSGFNPVTVSVASGLSASVGELFRHIMFSNSATDMVRRGDRWFQRNTSEPVIFLSAAFLQSDSIAYTGYAGISFSANGITGTNGSYGDLVSPTQKITPSGTLYYAQHMNGMYPPGTDTGKLRFMYASINYELVLVPNISSIFVDASNSDFRGDQNLISLMYTLIDSMYQEYYS